VTLPRAYTVKLLDLPPAASPTSYPVTVPMGFRWVVRSIECVNTVTIPEQLEGFEILNGAGVPIFLRRAPYVQSCKSYHWRGHAVIDQGDELEAITLDANWGVTITGYSFTVP
jgi:hypothetical protein